MEIIKGGTMQGTDFTKDRITGFYNLLGLIDYDLEKQSEREGVIIAIAIITFG